MFQKLSTITIAGSLALLSGTTPALASSAVAAPSHADSTAMTVSQRPVIRPSGERPAPVPRPTTIPSYDAKAMISEFAAIHLGVEPGVARALGVSGDLMLPPTVQNEVEAAVALAGQASVGTISLYENRGIAEVAVGTGTISGDLEADITAASLGSYALRLPQTALPADSAAAQTLLVALYPALADATLEPVSTEQGQLFKATTTTQQFDPETMAIVTTTKVILTGVNGKDAATVAWVVVGNGDFAVALEAAVDALPTLPVQR